MKAVPNVPRWTEPGGHVPQALGDALGAMRNDAPSAEQLERIIAGVSGSLSATPPVAPASLATPLKLGVLVIALAGAAWLGVRATTTHQPAQRPVVRDVAPLAPLAHEAPRVAPSAPPAPEPAPREQVPARSRFKARPKPQPVAAPAAESEPQDIAAEIALLRRARRAVESSPSDALELLAQHRRQIVQPAFAEERDAIEIEALLASGARERALAAERAFRARYPESAYGRRLERVLAADQ